MMREISFRAGALTTWSVEAENHTNTRDSFKRKTQDSSGKASITGTLWGGEMYGQFCLPQHNLCFTLKYVSINSELCMYGFMPSHSQELLVNVKYPRRDL